MSVSETPWYQVGPHGYFDLVRLARRGRNTAVRVGYLVALLGVLMVAYESAARAVIRHQVSATGQLVMRSQTEVGINHNALIAERFCIAILVLQNVAVLVLTPLYMASSIHEERDRRTFTLLFTTHLSAREIVLGKWLSRSAHIGGVLLAGLPVLGLVQLWGGIDMAMIVANYVNTAVLILSIGAFSILIAVRSRSVFRAVGGIYATFCLTLILVCSPSEIGLNGFFLLVSPYWDNSASQATLWAKLAVCISLHLGLTVFFLWRAIRAVESMRTEETPPLDQPDELAIEPNHNRFWKWPAIGGAALVWKECYLDRTAAYAIPLFLFPYSVIIFNVYMVIWLSNTNKHDTKETYSIEGILEAIIYGAFGSYVIGLAIRMAGCIVRERQRQTLESLLMLPITRSEFLWQKLLGNLKRYRVWLSAVIFPALVLLAFAKGYWPAALALPIVFLVHLAFFAGFGLLISIMCRSTVIAHVILGVFLLVIMGSPLLASTFLRLEGPYADVLYGVNPLLAWHTILEHWWHREQIDFAAEIVTCTLLYSAAAIFVWWLAWRRFERNPAGL